MEHRVAVTGIGAVSPNGIGREAFWKATRAGCSGVKRIESFDPKDLQVRIAGEIRGFDEDAYIDAKYRQHVSRAVTLARAAAGEALADAGLDTSKMSREELRRIGVLTGSGGGSQVFTEEQYRLYYEDRVKEVSVYTIPTSTIGSLSSEISMAFGTRGRSHLISTGCTSSTDAISYATELVRHGKLETAVAGGVDAPISYLIIRGFQLMRILTRDWNDEPHRGSRPFSKDRSGFVLGEGSWFFVLEPLERAGARGAKVYGEIVGYGSTCEAYHRVRLEEDGEEPARAMQLALEEAGIPPEAADYVNLHGTSTELNDRVETRSVRLCFGKHADRLPSSALKSLIGHPQGASGSAGLAATLLAMRDSVLPPTLNVDVPDPECDLDYVSDVGRHHDIEYALCNCIGFGSKNSALVVRNLGLARNGTG
jgi:3-oxoacyl-[acyl-carrier-protein] synthase II